MTKVKNTEVLSSLLSHAYHYKLVSIICWICETWPETVITEGWRPKKHDNDLHGLGRANDLRDRVYDDPQAVCDAINDKWEYDPKRPDYVVCKYHDSGNGLHFHIQVHPNTRQRHNEV